MTIFLLQKDHLNALRLGRYPITVLIKVLNISNFQWTPIEEIYSIEIICGLKKVRDRSYLSSFRLFDSNVNIFLIQMHTQTGKTKMG